VANDKARSKTTGVPTEITFETKPQIALSQIRRAIAGGVPKGVAVADAGYGNDTAFRDALTQMELPYVVGVQSSIAVWAPGTGPLPARPWSGRGRKTKLLRRENDAKPMKVGDLALALPRACRDVPAACASERPLRACAYDTVRLVLASRPAIRERGKACGAVEPAEVCERKRRDGGRSSRRLRTLVTQMADARPVR
jgi:hypothetical protein